MSKGTHEVYVCKHNGVIVYIGKGTKGRHKHCISGCSHVFELNKIYFTEGVDSLDVAVVKELSSNQEAMELEYEFNFKFKQCCLVQQSVRN